MKISKLFHWLYAILMFLPVFFIGGRTFYTIFNKNAFESYSGNVNIVYEEINNINDLVIGDRYLFNSTLGVYNDTSTKNSGRIFYSDLNVKGAFNANSQTYFDNGNNFIFYYSNQAISIYIFNNTTSTGDFTVTSNYSLSFDFILENYSEPLLSNNFSFLRSISQTNQSYLDNAFTYSMNEINENALFSWASTSFLVTPMSYIGNLFGLSATSPIITMLSYWLSISLIWLVFDLVMYVPLLVHRWIDKGIIE